MWNFYQFMYKGNEVLHAHHLDGTQRTFLVNGPDTLDPRTTQLKVEVEETRLPGVFHLVVSAGTRASTRRVIRVAMAGQPRGLCRGHHTHWAGKWTPLGYDRLQQAVEQHLMTKSGPGFDWLSEPYNVYPPGLTSADMEPCICQQGGYTGLPGNACENCMNTGVVPKQQTENKEMNTQELITVMQLQNGAALVRVRFIEGGNGRDYTYKNVLGVDLAKDDLVVVQTGDRLGLAEVQDPDVGANTVSVPLGSLKHVVSKVDTSGLKRVQESENSAAHMLALSEVTERLDRFKEQVGDTTFNNLKGVLSLTANKE